MEASQQALTEEQYRNARAVISAYKNVFSSPEGKIVLEDLERIHHVHSTIFNPNVENSIYFAEGERNVVLRIKALMAKDISQLDERMKNAQKPTLVV